MRRHRIPTLFSLLAMFVAIAAAQAPDSPRYRAATAARELIQGSVQPSAFAESRLAASTRDTLGADEAVARLKAVVAALDGFELADLRPLSPQVAEMTWHRGDDRRTVHVAFEPDPPHGITEIAVVDGPALVAAVAGDETPELTWDNLRERIDREVADGFSGVIVVVRDGETVLEGAFGKANREANIDNRLDTIFGIGSTPIDFTHVGILMLAQEGKLSLDDPITKFFDNVPEDKRGITVEHLRTSRSGLRDFHGVPEDGNPDHAWIDRDEAMRRIFGQELLFEPGQGRQHSHSAWGVLAAIIEIVSGKSYQEFTTERIFKPLGMKDTGFYGTPLPKERMAVGYGARSNGEINAPPYWGKTSWLVLGSGGQVSTAGDMMRFVRGIRAGRLLEPEMRDRLLGTWRGPMAGGSIFGYEIVYTTDPDNMMVLLSNHAPDGERSPAVELGIELAQLTLAEGAPRFSLGVGLEFEPERGLVVSRVVAGSAAERDGLQAGDELVSANGTSFGDDPMAVLDPLLRTGERITFAVRRSGEAMKVQVKPDPR